MPDRALSIGNSHMKTQTTNKATLAKVMRAVESQAGATIDALTEVEMRKWLVALLAATVLVMEATETSTEELQQLTRAA